MRACGSLWVSVCVCMYICVSLSVKAMPVLHDLMVPTKVLMSGKNRVNRQKETKKGLNPTFRQCISVWLHHPLIHHYNPLTNKDL